MKLDKPETLDGDNNKWKNSQRFDVWVNALERYLTFKNIDLNDRSALVFVGFQVTNSALVLCYQFQREQQEKDQTLSMFMLALRTFLMPSFSKDPWCKECATLTPTKDGKHMGIHRFTRALNNIQCKLINEQGRKSITDEVKITKFINNMADIIKMSITPHRTDDMTYNDIVTKLQQFEAANHRRNVEDSIPGYPSKVSRYTDAASTRSSYTTQQPRPDKGQLPQNRLATPGARSTASAVNSDSDWDKIKKTLSEKEGMSRVRKKVGLWCGLATHNFTECRTRLNKEPLRTAAQAMQLQQPVGETRSKEETKQKPPVAIRDPLDPN